MNHMRLRRWPATWALVAALTAASVLVVLRSCSRLVESGALSAFIAESRRVLGIGAPR